MMSFPVIVSLFLAFFGGHYQYVDSFTLQGFPSKKQYVDYRLIRKEQNQLQHRHHHQHRYSSRASQFASSSSWSSLFAMQQQQNDRSFSSSFHGSKNVLLKEDEIQPSFDPFNFATNDNELMSQRQITKQQQLHSSSSSTSIVGAATAATMMIPFVFTVDDAMAKMTEEKSLLLQGTMNPSNFNPVCPASDGFYRFLQGSTEAVVGTDNFVEFGPLIAGGLLRIRLELCVVESFFNEAVGPFIRQNGLSWILPLHETVETFIAGTIFSLATTFILVGSTKIITVIITYADILVGAPLRLLGGFAYDRATGKPVTLDIGFGPFKTRIIGPPDEKASSSTRAIKTDDDNKKFDFESAKKGNLFAVVSSGSLKAAGEASKILREFVEALDLFVGRYLVLLATGYIGIKFIHFKLFPDFPPF